MRMHHPVPTDCAPRLFLGVCWQMLIDGGADVKQRDAEGRTCMHWGSHAGHPGVIELMASRGGDVTARDKRGSIPLHVAARQGRGEACKLLIELGGDARARDSMFRTPLDVAGVSEEEDAARKGKVMPNIRKRKQARQAILTAQASCRVMVLYHPECLDHVTREGHQEAPCRVKKIADKIRSNKGSDRFMDYEIDYT